MHTRTLSRGTVEAYSEQLRIRLQPLPDGTTALVTVYHLKPNGYHYHKVRLLVAYPVSISELIGTFEMMT